jgi:fatty acid kinase
VVRGGLAAFTGEPLPSLKRLPAPSERTRRVIANASFPRYCTELVLTAIHLDRTALDVRLRQLGDCVDMTGVTGDREVDGDGDDGSGRPEETLHIHIHTDEPEALFAYAATLGTVSHRKVEDMEAQRARFLAGPEPQETGWVAVASGEGMRRVFENLPGVAGVINATADAPLEQTELAAALAHASAAQLLLLANDPTLWPAAQAAAAASARPALAVLTATLPEGIAAALAFDAAATLEDNAAAMLAAARSVRTVAASPAAFEAAEEEIAALGDGFSLVTLYTGAGASPEQADELAARLQRRFPGLETEVVEGGQPAPPLLLAVE